MAYSVALGIISQGNPARVSAHVAVLQKDASVARRMNGRNGDLASAVLEYGGLTDVFRRMAVRNSATARADPNNRDRSIIASLLVETSSSLGRRHPGCTDR